MGRPGLRFVSAKRDGWVGLICLAAVAFIAGFASLSEGIPAVRAASSPAQQQTATLQLPSTGRLTPGHPQALAAARPASRFHPNAQAPAPLMQFIPSQIKTLGGDGSNFNLSNGSPATATWFGNPEGIAVDAAGNEYITDDDCDLVYRIDGATGLLTILAGTVPSSCMDSGAASITLPGVLGPKTAAEHRKLFKNHFARMHSGVLKPNTQAHANAQLHANVLATSVALDSPEYVAIGPDGLVYFSDSTAHVIYRIQSDGTLTVFAGMRYSAGYSGDGGPAASAQLSQPEGINFDSAGNLYIAEYGNYVVRKVDTNGNISTVAGNNLSGYTGDGGPATAAELGGPSGVAVDATGNIYISDYNNLNVRKVDTTGTITTFAGTGTSGIDGDGGPAINATFQSPTGVAVDAGGAVYVSDESYDSVRKIDVNGIIRTVVGSATYGPPVYPADGSPAANGEFDSGNGVAVDAAGNVYVVTSDWYVAVKVGPGGILDFHQVTIGSSQSYNFTVSNAGTAPLSFAGQPAITGAGYSFAPASSNACNFTAPLAPGAACDVAVTYAPTGGSSTGGTLTFTDSAGNSPQVVPLIGQAYSANVKFTLAASATSLGVGGTLTLTATVASNTGGSQPTGSVTFYAGGNSVGSIPLSGGTAVNTGMPPAGNYAITAVYSGDANYTSSQSNTVYVSVVAPVASLSLTAAPTTVTANGIVGATATLTGSGTQPTGTVQFWLNGNLVSTQTVSGPIVSASMNAGGVGTDTLKAVYSGDANYASVTSNVATVTVTPPSPSVRFIPETITEVTGQGTQYLDNVPASNSSIGEPFGVAVDIQNDIYFTDSSHGTVRRIDGSTGIITTVAGSPGSGGGGGDVINPSTPASASKPSTFKDVMAKLQASASAPHRPPTLHPLSEIGSATSASLDEPYYIAVDLAGNLYFTDTGADVVYKVSNGTLYQIAGTQYSRGDNGDGGPATAARLNQPTGIAIDATGNLYISDSGNCTVRKIDTSGIISTVAGIPASCGYSGDGGPGTAAKLDYPYGLAVDSAGNVYITDPGNSVIRLLATNGTITTYGGDGNYNTAGDYGPVSSAEFQAPTGIRIDAAGDVFIADYDADIVRKVDAMGIIRTIAGVAGRCCSYSGNADQATQATLGAVNDVAIDSAGNPLFTLDDAYALIRVGPGSVLDFGNPNLPVTPTTQTLTIANTGSAPLTFTGAPAFTGASWSVAPAATNGCNFSNSLPVGGSCDLTITFAPTTAGTLDTTLTFSDNAATGTQTVTLHGSAQEPASITTLTASANSFVAGNPVTLGVSVASASGTGPVPTGSVTFLDGTSSVGTATLDSSGSASLTLTPAVGSHDYTASYAGDSNYATSTSSSQYVQVVAPVATLTLSASPTEFSLGSTTTATATITANGVTVPTGTITFYSSGQLVGTSAIANGSASFAVSPTTIGNVGITASYSGDGSYASVNAQAVTVIVHGGFLSLTPQPLNVFAGIPSDDNHGAYSGDGGSATNARLWWPAGIAFDHEGDLFIADQENQVIREVMTNGVIRTVMGFYYSPYINGYPYCWEGPSYLCNPAAIAVDPSDNVYIADYSNDRIFKMNPATRAYSVFAGVFQQAGYNGDGLATTKNIGGPAALAFDKAGYLYVADLNNRIIRKIDSGGNMTTIAGNPYSNYCTFTNGMLATQACFGGPSGIAVDNTNNVYFADYRNNVVYKLKQTDGTVSLYAGGGVNNGTWGDGGLATNAILSQPQHLTIDPAGNLYIADYGHSVVRRVDAATGLISTIAGTGTYTGGYDQGPNGLPATDYSIVEPFGLAFDSNYNLYISDIYGETILRSSGQGNVLFPQTPAGSTSAPQPLTLTNTGDQAFTFNATPYTISSDFTLTPSSSNGCVFTSPLSPGTSCSVSLVYAPTAGINGSGSVVFTDTAAGHTHTANLTINNNPSTASVELDVYGSPAVPGSTVQLFASLTGTSAIPSGNVTFFDGNTALGTIQLNANPSFDYAELDTTTLAVGPHSITAVYSGDAIYSSSVSSAQVVTVDATPNQTITVGTLPSPTYGSSFNTNVTSSSGLGVTLTVLSGPAVVQCCNQSFYANGVGTVTIQATQAGNTTYTPATPVTFTVNVTQAPLTAYVSNYTRSYGQVNPVFTASLSGFIGNDTATNATTGSLAFSTTAIGTSVPGQYPINATTGTFASTNYTLTAIYPGTLFINGPVPQTITFNPIPNLPVGTTLTLTARASSGLAVSYAVSGPATLTGNKLTVTGKGSISVTASQSGNSDYNAATPVTRTFTGQ